MPPRLDNSHEDFMFRRHDARREKLHQDAVARDAYATECWKRIQPLVEKAVTDKMHDLGVPADVSQKNAYNHYHNTAMAVAQSTFSLFIDDYVQTINADKRTMPRLKERLRGTENHVREQYKWLRSQVAVYGKLETATTDDGKLASWIISKFTEASSPLAEQHQVLHLRITGQNGPHHEDLTKLTLEEEFVKSIEIAGLDVVMLYLKQEFGLTADIKNLGLDIPRKPPVPETLAASGKPGRK